MTRTEERLRDLLKEEAQLLDMIVNAMGYGAPQFEELIASLRQNDRRRVHVLRQLDIELASRWAEACRV